MKKNPVFWFLLVVVILALLGWVVRMLDTRLVLSNVLEFRGQGREVSHLRFSPDGSSLLSVSGEFPSTIRVWNVESGKLDLEFDTALPVMAASWSRDGTQIRAILVSMIGKEEGIYHWDASNGKQIRFYPFQTPVKGRNPPQFQRVAISADGSRAVVAFDFPSFVGIYDLDNGKILTTLSSEGAGSDALKQVLNVATTLSRTAFINERGVLTVWDVERNTRIARFQDGNHKNLVFSPKGSLLFAAPEPTEFGTITGWDVETGKQAGELKFHRWGPLSVTVSPDGKYAISGGMHVDDTDWQVASTVPHDYGGEVVLWDLRSWKVIDWIQAHDSVERVAFSPRGRLAAAATRKGKVFLIRVEEK